MHLLQPSKCCKALIPTESVSLPNALNWITRCRLFKRRLAVRLPALRDRRCGGQSELASDYLESVNHLYSMEKKQGPIVLKVRVPRNNPRMPSLTPLYRGAEYQEREAYDLFGIVYEGHPDLRRILMWDEFEGHPMRKDYVEEDQDVR